MTPPGDSSQRSSDRSDQRPVGSTHFVGIDLSNPEFNRAFHDVIRAANALFQRTGAANDMFAGSGTFIVSASPPGADPPASAPNNNQQRPESASPSSTTVRDSRAPGDSPTPEAPRGNDWLSSQLRRTPNEIVTDALNHLAQASPDYLRALLRTRSLDGPAGSFWNVPAGELLALLQNANWTIDHVTDGRIYLRATIPGGSAGMIPLNQIPANAEVTLVDPKGTGNWHLAINGGRPQGTTEAWMVITAERQPGADGRPTGPQTGSSAVLTFFPGPMEPPSTLGDQNLPAGAVPAPVPGESRSVRVTLGTNANGEIRIVSVNGQPADIDPRAFGIGSAKLVNPELPPPAQHPPEVARANNPEPPNLEALSRMSNAELAALPDAQRIAAMRAILAQSDNQLYSRLAERVCATLTPQQRLEIIVSADAQQLLRLHRHVQEVLGRGLSQEASTNPAFAESWNRLDPLKKAALGPALSANERRAVILALTPEQIRSLPGQVRVNLAIRPSPEGIDTNRRRAMGESLSSADYLGFLQTGGAHVLTSETHLHYLQQLQPQQIASIPNLDRVPLLASILSPSAIRALDAQHVAALFQGLSEGQLNHIKSQRGASANDFFSAIIEGRSAAELVALLAPASDSHLQLPLNVVAEIPKAKRVEALALMTGAQLEQISPAARNSMMQGFGAAEFDKLLKEYAGRVESIPSSMRSQILQGANAENIDLSSQQRVNWLSNLSAEQLANNPRMVAALAESLTPQQHLELLRQLNDPARIRPFLEALSDPAKRTLAQSLTVAEIGSFTLEQRLAILSKLAPQNIQSQSILTGAQLRELLKDIPLPPTEGPAQARIDRIDRIPQQMRAAILNAFTPAEIADTPPDLLKRLMQNLNADLIEQLTAANRVAIMAKLGQEVGSLSAPRRAALVADLTSDQIKSLSRETRLAILLGRPEAGAARLSGPAIAELSADARFEFARGIPQNQLTAAQNRALREGLSPQQLARLGTPVTTSGATDFTGMNGEQLGQAATDLQSAWENRPISTGLADGDVMEAFAALFRQSSDTMFQDTNDNVQTQATSRATRIQAWLHEQIQNTDGFGIGISANNVSVEPSSNVGDGGQLVVRHGQGGSAIEGTLVGASGDSVQIRLVNGEVVTRPRGEIRLVIRLSEAQLNQATGMTSQGADVTTRFASSQVASGIFRCLAEADAILNNRLPAGFTTTQLAEHLTVARDRVQLSLNAGRLTPNHNLGAIQLTGVDVARVIGAGAQPQSTIHISIVNGVPRYELVSGSERRALTQEETERLERQLREYHESLYAQEINTVQNDSSLSEDQKRQRVEALRADLELYRTDPVRRAQVHVGVAQELRRPGGGGGGGSGIGRGAISAITIIIMLAGAARQLTGSGTGSGGLPVTPVQGGS